MLHMHTFVYTFAVECASLAGVVKCVVQGRNLCHPQAEISLTYRRPPKAERKQMCIHTHTHLQSAQSESARGDSAQSGTGVCKINARYLYRIIMSASPPSPPKFKVDKKAPNTFYVIGCLSDSAKLATHTYPRVQI